MNIKVMKVKYLALSVMMGAMALVSANAQETTAPENQLPANRTAFEPSAGHWFIEVQAGETAQFFNANDVVPFMDRIKANFNNPKTIMPTLSIGKWHNPYFGTRLQLMSGLSPVYQLKYAGTDVKREAVETMVMGAHFDFMFDMVNYFAKYNPKRVFHFTPFVGLGYQFKTRGFYKFDQPQRHSASVNAGLQMAFRLGKRVDFLLEGQAIYGGLNFTKRMIDSKATVDPYFDGIGGYDGVMALVTAGLRFNLGATDWKTVTPMDYNMINGLNDQINALRAENAELSKRPVSCPECPEVEAPKQVEVVNILAPRSILFGFDKATIAPKQEYKLVEIANFVKETNTPILVLGYSDTTGNTEYNMSLSERRAKAVADALTNEYGVPADMINVEWKGETDQFTSKAWNRVVIVRSK